MEIKGKVHCFFEQSGTFKNEFIKLGIPAEDYDIQNNFGQTDHVIDLFAEIEKAYEGGASIFNTITKEDLIMAFFPCIYFCEMSMLSFTCDYVNYIGMKKHEIIDKIIEREKNRDYYYTILLKFVGICEKNELRLIVENPYSPIHFLINNFPQKASFIDKDRTKRGDFFKKPTQYFFFNCKQAVGFTEQRTPKEKIHTIRKSKSSGHSGLCSEERSMISPYYARNLICDNILGITQRDIDKQTSIFDFLND